MQPYLGALLKAGWGGAGTGSLFESAAEQVCIVGTAGRVRMHHQLLTLGLRVGRRKPKSQAMQQGPSSSLMHAVCWLSRKQCRQRTPAAAARGRAPGSHLASAPAAAAAAAAPLHAAPLPPAASRKARNMLRSAAQREPWVAGSKQQAVLHAGTPSNTTHSADVTVICTTKSCLNKHYRDERTWV